MEMASDEEITSTFPVMRQLRTHVTRTKLREDKAMQRWATGRRRDRAGRAVRGGFRMSNSAYGNSSKWTTSVRRGARSAGL